MSTESNIKWAFLCSSWGRNAKDTLDVYLSNGFNSSEVGLVVYEETPCGAADLAKENNIETLMLPITNFKNTKEYQTALVQELQKRAITHLFLMGYKHILKSEALEAFPNRIINVHPSLFPSFLGTKTAIQDALDYGVKVTGITTHVIDHKIDMGTILCQEPIRINENDTFETLCPKFSKKGLTIILETIQLVENKYEPEKIRTSA